MDLELGLGLQELMMVFHLRILIFGIYSRILGWGGCLCLVGSFQLTGTKIFIVLLLILLFLGLTSRRDV